MPHGPLAPSTSHSISALSTLSPGHTVLWLLPRLIRSQPCPRFLHATRSSGSFHVSFDLSPVHAFSMPHGPLAPSTSHSSSALSTLSPGHRVLWLPPRLILSQPCPRFLHATRSSASLHVSFELSPVHAFSRPHGPLPPSTSHSSSALHHPTTISLAFLVIFSHRLYPASLSARVPVALTTSPNHLLK